MSAKQKKEQVTELTVPKDLSDELARQEQLADETGGVPILAMKEGSDRAETGLILCDALGIRTRGPLTAYLIGHRRSRAMFPGKFREGDRPICASEYSDRPVSAETAVKAQITNPQPGPLCKDCRYQSWAWARFAQYDSPPCSVSIALLVAVEITEYSHILAIMRGRRTSYGAVSRIIQACKAHAADYRRVPVKVSVTTAQQGSNLYPQWRFDVDSLGMKQIDPEGFPWGSWFTPDQVVEAMRALLSPYYDRAPEEDQIPAAWKDSLDDIPF